MPAREREKIQADLQTLEQGLRTNKSSKEEMALKKADYFLNYKIKQEVAQNNEAPNAWSDALQTLFEIENPSPSFVKQRQGYIINFRKSCQMKMKYFRYHLTIPIHLVGRCQYQVPFYSVLTVSKGL